jgi:hypothetical protein
MTHQPYLEHECHMFRHSVNRILTTIMVSTKCSTSLTSWPYGVLWAFGSRSVALLISYLQTKWKWINKFKPRPDLPQEWTPLPIALGAVWAPEVALMLWRWKKTLARTETRSPDLPARNVVAMPNTLLRMECIN